MIKHMLRSVIFQLIAIAGIGYLSQSCAPVFSEMQSARTVGKGNAEFTPSFSSVSFTESGESEGVQNHFGLQAAVGLMPRFDLRMRYEYIWAKDDPDAFGDGVNVIGLGPKVSLIEDVLAFSMPIGTAFGDLVDDSGDYWEIQPTFIVSAPLARDKVELNLAPKYLMLLCNECDDLFALNMGMAFSSDLNKWAFRPEYGMLFNPGESGHFGQFSVGFSVVLNKDDE